VFPFPGPDGITKDGDTLVVASFEGEFVARVNPNNGNIIQQVDVGGTPTEVISHPDHGLWAAVFDTGELVEIDRDTFEILRRVVVGQGPVGISAGASHLWVTNHAEGTIAKVDPGTGEVALTVAVGNGPTGLVVANGSVWVTVTDDGNLLQVDPNSGDLLSSTPLGGASAGGGPTGIDAFDGTLWVAMQGEQSVVRIDLAA
jgi:DNA-binding beta-propeller fold protein YncE